MGWVFLVLSWASFFPKRRSAPRGAAGRQTGKDVRIAGACAALGRTIFATQSLAYQRPGNKFRARLRSKSAVQRHSERGDHAGDGVAEGGAAIEVGLPEALEDVEIVFPAALVEAFAEGVGSVSGGGSSGGVFAGTGSGASGGRGGASGGTAVGAKVQFAAGSGIGRGENGAEDLAGGVENQGVPEVARDGFIALAAFADDGVLHGLGDAVGGFVEENFEGFGVLVARVEAGDGDAQGIERGVSAGRIGIRGDVHADFLARPASLINVREALGEADALFDDQRSDAQDPAAIGAVMIRPEMRTVDGSGGLESLG